MNRLSAILFIVAFSASSIMAQSNPAIDGLIDPLTDDINALANSICEDTAPELLQLALAGDNVGAAAFDGNFPHGTVILPALGITFGNGIATVLNDGARSWKFVTPIPTLIKNSIGTSGSSYDMYMASRKVCPYPSFAGGLGFGITNDIEVLCSGVYIPQALTDALVRTINNKNVSALNPQFSTGGVVLKVRKVFFRDSKSWPAMSVSLGGAYGATTIGANIDLAQMLGSAVDLSGIGTMNLTGPVTFNANMYAIGMDFAISKQFLIFIPFLRTGIWYHRSTVSSNFDLTAKFYDTSGADITTKNIKVSPSSVNEAISGRIGGGVEFRFWPIVFHISADLDLADPLINISKWSLTGIALEGLTLKTGFRVAF